MSDPQTVLVVEDSPLDYEVTVRALREAGVAHTVLRSEDGDSAVDFLETRLEDGSELPCLILLDLNLPGSCGHDVLETIRSTEGLRHIPVVVLTTSSAARDIRHSYSLGANSYIQKPVDLEQFRASMSHFAAYWFGTVLLPDKGRGAQAA